MSKRKSVTTIAELQEQAKAQLLEEYKRWLEPDTEHGHTFEPKLSGYVRSAIEGLVQEALGVRRSGFGAWEITNRGGPVINALRKQLEEKVCETAKQLSAVLDSGLTDKEKRAIQKTFRAAYIERMHDEAKNAGREKADQDIERFLDDQLATDSTDEIA